jgi:hypothetical protein
MLVDLPPGTGRHSPFYCTILAYHGCCIGAHAESRLLADAKRSFDVYV